MEKEASIPEPVKLSGSSLWLAAIMLALGNFVAVLDMTITNVAVPTIAGSLGISTSQGTWIITSYAVAEAISVPLTGWLSQRFGSVRVFTSAMLLFGLTSLICGISTTFPMLLAGRILQGLCGGPMMPLAQTLLMRIFPRDKVGAAMGLWAMTTLVAPVAGPILGGFLCEYYKWEYAFLINVPIAIVCSMIIYPLLRSQETPIEKKSVDFIGLGLMVLWIAALQIMLDEGKDKDWFASEEIRNLGMVAIVGFFAFLIWELTEKNPIVDLRVFRHRGYVASVTTLVVAFGAFFGINVLNPLWLQGYMGYTSTWSGMATAWTGALAIFMAPMVGAFGDRFDPRKLVFIGVSWLGFIALVRSFGTTDMTYWNVAFPLFIMGVGMPLFFVPLSSMALRSVKPNEAESAAGLMAFLRTLAGAFATSTVTTIWDNKIKENYADLAGSVDATGELARNITASGGSQLDIASNYSQNLMPQAVMLATNETFMLLAVITFFAACMVFLVPKPSNDGGPVPMGH